mmetsp:Transcript_115026/g.325048  ORF Transcript_115026/g.325048 Transcript_115026/m.325048 type:complete len:237 (+) Transcript_115026:151-861(+)
MALRGKPPRSATLHPRIGQPTRDRSALRGRAAVWPPRAAKAVYRHSARKQRGPGSGSAALGSCTEPSRGNRRATPEGLSGTAVRPRLPPALPRAPDADGRPAWEGRFLRVSPIGEQRPPPLQEVAMARAWSSVACHRQKECRVLAREVQNFSVPQFRLDAKKHWCRRWRRALAPGTQNLHRCHNQVQCCQQEQPPRGPDEYGDIGCHQRQADKRQRGSRSCRSRACCTRNRLRCQR